MSVTNEAVWKNYDLKTEAGRRYLEQHIAKQLGYTIYHYDKDYVDHCYFMLMTPDWDSVVHTNFDRFADEIVKLNIRAGERKTEAEAWLDCPRWLDDTDLAFELAGEKFQELKRLTDGSFAAGVGEIEIWNQASEVGSTVAEAIVLACCAWNDRTQKHDG